MAKVECMFKDEVGPCWGTVDPCDEDGEGSPIYACEAHWRFDFRKIEQGPDNYYIPEKKR